MINIQPVKQFGLNIIGVDISSVQLDEIARTAQWKSSLVLDDQTLVFTQDQNLTDKDFDTYYNSVSTPGIVDITLSRLGVKKV